MHRLWVVSYDISDNTKRVHIANYLLGWGERVLDSVFECVWRADQIETIQRDLQRFIDPSTDRLWLVPVCHRCRKTAQVNGQRRAVEHCSHYVV